ncbi:MAG: glycosyltransferase family 2 protein [Betaproteobacteria bacterium]
MNITAVVVTYNRSTLLTQVLSCLSAQTHLPQSVIVVDNASTDDTPKVVAEISQNLLVHVNYIRLTSNQGGAGGFFHGMVAAYKGNADYIWVMDDDCLPTPTALQVLSEATKKFDYPIGFLSSYVAFKDGKTCVSNVPGPYHSWLADFSDLNHSHANVRLGWATFVSCLVSRTAIDKVGFPVREFFIWGDDIEYTSRISSTLPCYFVQDSLVHHHTHENRPNTYNYANHKTLWKFKYAMRNVTAFIRYTQPSGFLRAINYWRGAYREMRVGQVPYRFRLALFGQWLKGLYFNFKKLVVMPSQL